MEGDCIRFSLETKDEERFENGEIEETLEGNVDDFSETCSSSKDLSLVLSFFICFMGLTAMIFCFVTSMILFDLFFEEEEEEEGGSSVISF